MKHKPLLSDERRKKARGHQRTRSAESNAGSPTQYEPTVGSTYILGLQRSVGNAAVQRLLGPTPQRNHVIQREPQESQGYVTVPDLKAGARLLGPALRSKISSVVRQGKVAQEKRKELDGLVEFLRMAADPKGGSAQAAVQTVGAVKSAAKGLGGSRRDALEAAIDKYNTSKPHLRAMMSEIEAARATIVASTKKLESKVLGKKLIDTHRAKDTAEGQLKEMEDKKASANKVLSGFISFAGMLANPTQGWKTALDSATSIVGNFIEDLALGGTYAAQIAALRDKVATLSQSIVGLEDAQALADIDSAAAELKAAQKILEARLNELESAVYAAETAQDDVQKELRKLGKKGAAAADAFTEGSAVIETGNEAITKSMAHQQVLETMKMDIAFTFKQSDDYRQWTEMDGSNMSGVERAWARDAAIQNVRASQSWDRWVTAESDRLAEDQKFLTARSYQAGYEQGVETQLTKIRRK